jgi:hypothetical protein
VAQTDVKERDQVFVEALMPGGSAALARAVKVLRLNGLSQFHSLGLVDIPQTLSPKSVLVSWPFGYTVKMKLSQPYCTEHWTCQSVLEC